jgi:hypothetical protein
MPAVATGAVDLKCLAGAAEPRAAYALFGGCDLVTAVPLFRRAQAVTLVALFGGSKRLARNFGRFGSASCTRRRPRGRNGCGLALWYARAAAAGYHRAQYAFAQRYAAGDGVWCRAAARGGLRAASAHLPALMRAGRATASPPPGDLSLVRPIPVAPVDAVLSAGQNPSKVALVWNTPEQPVPVEYYVELKALASGSREVAASYVETSATLVELPGAPQRYAWRVYAVARSGAHYYATSPWNSFLIGKGAAN